MQMVGYKLYVTGKQQCLIASQKPTATFDAFNLGHTLLREGAATLCCTHIYIICLHILHIISLNIYRDLQSDIIKEI